MLRKSALSLACVLALQSGLAVAAAPPKPAVYRLEAYIDRAPKGVEVLDEVRIGRAGRSRVLLIVGVRSGDSDNPGKLFRDVEEGTAAVQLAGRSDDVVKLMQGKAGDKVTGFFAYRPGIRTLLVQNVEE